ncbi:MAG: DNA repair protein RecN [Nitrospirota bacterium]
MLKELSIKNFAIIDKLHITFSDGLNILTGETGAGKSIIIDAVELLLGKRASTDQIRTGYQDASITGVFDISHAEDVKEILEKIGLCQSVAGDELIIRRILSRSGKNRVYINDEIISLSSLLRVGGELIDIHGQNEHQSILNTDRQTDLLDAFGGLFPIRSEYERYYNILKRHQKELYRLEELERDRLKQVEFLNFQRDEILAADLKDGEDEELERERNLLSNAEKLSILSNEAYHILYVDEDSILSGSARVGEKLKELSSIDNSIDGALTLFESASLQLKEVSDIIRDYKEKIEYNPALLDDIGERLDIINRLKKKYGDSINDILLCLSQIDREIGEIEREDERRIKLKDDIAADTKIVSDLAMRLSDKRNDIGKKFEEKVEKVLKDLNMEHTRFKISINNKVTPCLNKKGMDRIEFLISPDIGEKPKPLSRVASGGELSRIMLALKSILAEVDRIPTLTFDEVDSGIGGGVAESVGRRLKDIANSHQVFCITHLPQIASMADNHFLVEKVMNNNRAETVVKEIDYNKRIKEIARMLGGKTLTKATIQHAEEMLNYGINSEKHGNYSANTE